MNLLALLVMLLPGLVLILIFFGLKNKQLILARVFLISGISLAAFITLLWIMDLSDSLAHSHFNRISSIVSRSLAVPTDENQQQYLLMGLSNAAEGIAQYASAYPEKDSFCLSQLRSIVAFVTDDANYPAAANKRLWKNNYFYLIHLNCILASYEKTLGRDSISPLHQNVNTYLADGIVQSRYKNIQTLKGDNGYWPADNTLLISGLYETDQLAHSNKAARASKDWASFVASEVSYDDSSLPCSAFTEKNKCKEMPHGTHLATMVSGLSDCAPAMAKKIWKEFKNKYKNGKLGIFASFEQFHPKEVSPAYASNLLHPLDAVSPAIAALKAAANYGDRLTYFQLSNQLWLNDVFAKRRSGRNLKGYQWKDFLELSMRFNAETVF